MKTIIDSRKNKFINFKELINYKDLFITLSWRDFRVRYAQTTIGFLWAIMQPIITLLILSLVFGKFAGVNTGVPHILFTIIGTSIWTYFSYVMINSGNSIIANQNMVKKFTSQVNHSFIKSSCRFYRFWNFSLIMTCIMIYYNISPSANVIFAPIFILISILAALAVGIWLSALTVRFRDFQHVVPFIVQIGLYITPIAYPASFAIEKLPSWARTIYFLNPMAGVVQGFRWSILGGDAPGKLMYVSIGIILLALITGLAYFSKVQDEMADYV